MIEEEMEAKAAAFAEQVSTSYRVHADLYIGDKCYNSVTEIVKAAFLAGMKQTPQTREAFVKQIEQLALDYDNGLGSYPEHEYEGHAFIEFLREELLGIPKTYKTEDWELQLSQIPR